MNHKIVGRYSHPEHSWIVETVRGNGDVRSITCARCNVAAILYRRIKNALAQRQKFVKTHSKCKQKRGQK